MTQGSLFPDLPPGLTYRPGFISEADEAELVRRIEPLPFKVFEFQGYLGKRRVVSFGWRYDFNEASFQRVELMPDFLHPLRDACAAYAGLDSAEFEHVLLTEYAPGAAIGWHRDRPQFDKVVGVSLLSPCTFRLRKREGAKWRRASFTAEPRSVYLIDGEARREWEHSIPAVDALRYSVTFRSLRR